MFEVLMYLFENYMDNEASFPTNQETIINELASAGFQLHAINSALNWLEGLVEAQARTQTLSLHPMRATRHYSNIECVHLDTETRGFLLFLEQLNILDPATREIVIDRLMALETGDVNSHAKIVVLIVLFSQPDKKIALALLQDILLMDTGDILQ